MRWPWTPKPESRQLSFTDTLVNHILATARGDVAEGLAAAVEVCAGQWQRAFASAEIAPDGVVADAFAPFLGYVGRQLVLSGEAIFYIAAGDGEMRLIPAHTTTITGDARTWDYELHLAGPSEQTTIKAQSDRVLHLQYAFNPASPWRGVSPIEASATTRELLENLEKRLAQEADAAVGELIPVPNVQTTGKLQDDLRAMRGNVTLVETTAQGFGAGATGAPQSDYQVRRIGANPPATLPALREQTERSILAACGIPQSVINPGDAAGSREGFRQFLHLTIQPVAEAIAQQIAAKFDLSGFSFSFDRLMAGDLSGRARAFQSMVGGGMPVEDAARLSGLMTAD